MKTHLIFGFAKLILGGIIINKLKDFKILTNYFDTTSENLFNFVEQLEAQCPTVDGMINDANNLLKDVQLAMRHNEDDIDELYETLDNASYYLGNVEYDFEKLREAIIDIRAWGQDWKNFAKYLMEKMPIDEVLDELNLNQKDYNNLLEIVNEKGGVSA